MTDESKHSHSCLAGSSQALQGQGVGLGSPLLQGQRLVDAQEMFFK